MTTSSDCCLCSQIQGRPGNDLIASMLRGRSYVRRVMFESDSFAVVPSLGPLTPGHSLLCPKQHVRSFAEVDPALDAEYRRVLAFVSGRLSAVFEPNVLVFEHGMATDGRTVCTVDHAHLHLVPLPVGVDVPANGWPSFGGSLRDLRARCEGREYIWSQAAGRPARVLTTSEQPLESQYMRRVVAEAIARPARWDWRATPDPGAADATWRRFVGRA